MTAKSPPFFFFLGATQLLFAPRIPAPGDSGGAGLRLIALEPGLVIRADRAAAFRRYSRQSNELARLFCLAGPLDPVDTAERVGNRRILLAAWPPTTLRHRLASVYYSKPPAAPGRPSLRGPPRSARSPKRRPGPAAVGASTAPGGYLRSVRRITLPTKRPQRPDRFSNRTYTFSALAEPLVTLARSLGSPDIRVVSPESSKLNKHVASLFGPWICRWCMYAPLPPGSVHLRRTSRHTCGESTARGQFS